MPIAIRFRNVSFTYPSGKAVCTGLDLELPANKTIILTGENGLGKTTLALLAAGLLKPSAGTVNHLQNECMIHKKQNLYKELTILQQQTQDNLLCSTPYDDLKLWLSAVSCINKSEAKLISEILLAWNLESKTHTPVWELSAGELKCLALAGVSMHKDRYWILDEPLASLDASHTATLVSTLKSKQIINRGMLIVSHRTDWLASLADETLVLTEGGRMTRA